MKNIIVERKMKLKLYKKIIFKLDGHSEFLRGFFNTCLANCSSNEINFSQKNANRWCARHVWCDVMCNCFSEATLYNFLIVCLFVLKCA